MTQARASRTNSPATRPEQGQGSGPMGVRWQAYLLAREAIRRHKPSTTPCFARDWRPKSSD